MLRHVITGILLIFLPFQKVDLAMENYASSDDDEVEKPKGDAIGDGDATSEAKHQQLPPPYSSVLVDDASNQSPVVAVEYDSTRM
jgi:hypothetical protein